MRAGKMHLEILIEDSSGTKLLEILIPQLIGSYGNPHTWRLHAYKGIGRFPPNLATTADPAKRQLLAQLPKLLRGYGRTPGVDAVVIVVDTDSRDCQAFLAELAGLAANSDPQPRTLFRLAIEEIEAWYFGDRQALMAAYPRAKKNILDAYEQDSVCNTWERLADCIHPGGSASIGKAGWPAAGRIKHEWAERIGPKMKPEQNASPSFCRLRDGLLRLAVEIG